MKRRNDSSSTTVTTIQVVRKTYRLEAGFCSYLCRKIHIFKKFKRPWMFEC